MPQHPPHDPPHDPPQDPQHEDDHTAGPKAARSRRRRLAVFLPVTLLAIGSGALMAIAARSPAATATSTASAHPHAGHHALSDADRIVAMRANAAYQDVATAEAAGYASSLNTLGCFQNPAEGGMGVHYIDESRLDSTVEIDHPEALVYELDATGTITGLVAHEYIVPVDAWTSTKPPRLFGVDFHRHPTLPLWVLHTWLWKDNPAGVFEDWNPAVRLCPDGVPVFGRDLPAQPAGS